MALKPLIGVTAGIKQIGLHPYHASGDKSLRAISGAALGLSVIIPSLAELTEIDELLAQLDGVLLTGSPSSLRAEAVAPDGLIEAISVEHSQAFAVGMQWHPEWQVLDNPPYLSIFQAFGEACRQRAALRDTR